MQISIGELIESAAEYKGVELLDNREIDVCDLGIYVPTPMGQSLIKCVIKKENLQGIKLSLATGVDIKCANKHILRYNNTDVFADSLAIGDLIETINGNVEITNIGSIEDTEFYDIGIDAPHLYYDAEGVLHHNTITTATLSHLCEPYGRTMVIVPNKSLVVQTEEDYRNLGLDVGVYFGDRKELNKTHTICTWQSLNVLDKKGFDDATLSLAEFCEGVVGIIIDEVHQAKAEVLTKLLTQNFKNCPIRWGLTGTVPKENWEFQGILASIGPVINQVSAHDLQEKGVLAQLNINVLQTNEVQVFTSFADEYKFLVTDDSRLTWIANKIQELSLSGNTLVLINRIDTGNKLIERLPQAVFVSGGMKLDDRKEEYDEIKTSDDKIIVATYGVAAVGINIPRIFNLVLLEPGKSFVRVIQSIGRGIRKAQDKDSVEIWDITSQCKYSKRHLTERKKFYKDAKYSFTITKVNI
jgi:hypothetical protein